MGRKLAVRRRRRTVVRGRGRARHGIREHRSSPLARRLLLGVVAFALGFAPLTGPTTSGPAAGLDPVAFRLHESDAARSRPVPSPAPAVPSPAVPVSAAAAVPGDKVIAPPPATFDAPPPAPAPPPATLRSAAASPSGGVWAVIVGIDNYPGGRSDLRASVADARDVDAALAAYGVSGDRRLVLTDTQATAGTIVAALDWLASRAAADATAVFFYAGHVRKLRGGTEAIVAADGRLVTDATVASRLASLQARQAWIGIAACYGGGFTEVLRPGRILTGAADANSLAYENSRYGRSYMVEYMVRRAMLLGQAATSVEQSFAWAQQELRRDHPNRMPVQFDQLDGELRLGPPPPSSGSTSPPPPPPPQPPPDDQPNPDPQNPHAPPDDDDDDDCIVSMGSLVGCGRSGSELVRSRHAAH